MTVIAVTGRSLTARQQAGFITARSSRSFVLASRRALHWTPVARAVDIVGDKWSLLIIRDAFDGIRRFNQFQRDLGVAKNILAARLRDLVQVGVLRGEPHSVLVNAVTGEPMPRLSYTTPDGDQVQARQTRVRKVGEPGDGS